MKRCPKCAHILYRLSITHPWRFYCPQCQREDKMMDFTPTLDNLIQETDKILASIPKSTYPDYAKTFKDTLIEQVIFSGGSFEEAASEYCREAGWREPR